MSLSSRRVPETGRHGQALGSVLQGLYHDSCDNKVRKRGEDKETVQNAPAFSGARVSQRRVGAALSMKTVPAPNIVSAPMFLLFLTSAPTRPPGREDSAEPVPALHRGGGVASPLGRVGRAGALLLHSTAPIRVLRLHWPNLSSSEAGQLLPMESLGLAFSWMKAPSLSNRTVC